MLFVGAFARMCRCARSVVTGPLFCSSFERLLDHLAKAEERNILDIRPTPEEYRLVLLSTADGV